VYKKILVGYDGSAAAQKAFEVACNLAIQHGAELFVLTVSRPPEIADDVETEALIENSRHYHRRMLAELKGPLATKKIKSYLEVAVGHPAEQLIYYGDKHGVDLVVVGDRGRSKFARLLLGSTSKQVTEHAGRAVLVVR